MMQKTRAEEVWAAELVQEWLRENMPSATIIKGNDPPDFFVVLGKAKIALEITQTKSFELTDEGIGNRTTTDRSLLKLINDLNKEIGPKFTGNSRVMIIAKQRIPKRENAVFRKWVFDCVTKMAEGMLQGELNHEYIEIKPYSAGAVEGKRVTGIVVNKNGIRNISDHAWMSLESALKAKQERLDKAEWRGERWLALINTLHFLADARTYAVCMNQLKSSFSFARVFLLMPYDPPSLHELFPMTNDV